VPHDTADVDRPDDPPAPAEPKKSGWHELPVLAIVALLIAILIKTFLVQAFWIPSASMVPTLDVGDRVLVCRICYTLGGVHREDVIVFSNPHPEPSADPGVVTGFFRWLSQGLGVGSGGQTDYIKRVIGLPGDTVELRSGRLYVNGAKVAEPYVNHADPSTSDFGPVTVPAGDLFVMGDNRNHSGDSRFQPPAGLGWVPESKVVGIAFLRIWPPSRIGGMP